MSNNRPSHEQFPIVYEISETGHTFPHLDKPALLQLGGTTLSLVPELRAPVEQLKEYTLFDFASVKKTLQTMNGTDRREYLSALSDIDKVAAQDEALPSGVLYLHNGEEIHIGRQNPGSFELPNQVSRAHAYISIDQDGIRIADEKSTNGTRLFVSEEDSQKEPVQLAEQQPLPDKSRDYLYRKFCALLVGSPGCLEVKTSTTNSVVSMGYPKGRTPVVEVDIFDANNLEFIRPDDATHFRNIVIDPSQAGIWVTSFGRRAERANSYALKNTRYQQLSENQAQDLKELSAIFEKTSAPC